MSGDKPGNGKTSPYGDGKGGNGVSMSGNNFVKNPAGSNAGGAGGGPNSRAGAGGQPSSFMQSRPQQRGEDKDINPAEIPAGGKQLFADNKTVPGEQAPGVGSIGNASKPFRVS